METQNSYFWIGRDEDFSEVGGASFEVIRMVRDKGIRDGVFG